MPDQTLISTLRGQLEDEHTRLQGQIAALTVGSDDAPSYDENFADSGQVAAEQGENKALLNQFQDQLDEVPRDRARPTRRGWRPPCCRARSSCGGG